MLLKKGFFLKYFLILLILFSFSQVANGAERTVEEFGPCWASHQKGFPIQIASFSSGISYQIEEQDFVQIIDTFKEDTHHLNLTSLHVQNISAHCGAYGHALFVALKALNSKSEKMIYCLKLSKKKGGQTWDMDWGVDPYYQNEGACFGVSRGELLLNVTQFGSEWKEILSGPKLKNIIEGQEELNSHWVKISLASKWQGQEPQAQVIIAQILEKKSSDFLEFLHWIQPIGEYYSFPFKK